MAKGDKIIMAYVGLQIAADGSKIHAYRVLEPGVTLDMARAASKSPGTWQDWVAGNTRTMQFDGPLSKLVRVGSVYAHESGKDDDSSVIRGGQYVGEWPNEVERTAWSVWNDDVEERFRADRKPSPHLEVLDPLARVYRSATSMQRAVIVAQIIRYLDSAAYRAQVADRKNRKR